MELMVSAALFPSLCLCLCCLWCQMHAHWQATRKVSDAASQRSAKGRKFRADELPGSKSLWRGVRDKGAAGSFDSIGSMPPSQGLRGVAARAREQARECKQQSSWQSTTDRAKEQARGRAQQNSWRDTTARAKEHARCESAQAAREANRLPPLPSACPSAAAPPAVPDPFARRKLPSIRGAALVNAALQTLGDVPRSQSAEPHRPSPMPPVRSGSSAALLSICKSSIQPNIVAPRAKRPPPAPPTDTSALVSASPQVPRAKRPPPEPPTSSPPPRRSLSTSFAASIEQRKPEGRTPEDERNPEPEPKRKLEEPKPKAEEPTSKPEEPKSKSERSSPASAGGSAAQSANAGGSASTPAVRKTVHVLVGGKTGLVRACLPQIQPAFLQMPILFVIAWQVVACKKTPGHRPPPLLPPGSSDAPPTGIFGVGAAWGERSERSDPSPPLRSDPSPRSGPVQERISRFSLERSERASGASERSAAEKLVSSGAHRNGPRPRAS